MSEYIDPNSGRVPQPGGAFRRFVPAVPQAGAMVDVAVADEVTEADEAARTVEPKARRRRVTANTE